MLLIDFFVSEHGHLIALKLCENECVTLLHDICSCVDKEKQVNTVNCVHLHIHSTNFKQFLINSKVLLATFIFQRNIISQGIPGRRVFSLEFDFSLPSSVLEQLTKRSKCALSECVTDPTVCEQIGFQLRLIRQNIQDERVLQSISTAFNLVRKISRYKKDKFLILSYFP